MISRKPIPFQAALDALRVKSLLPTTAGSRQLEQLSAEIRRHAQFSAKTNSAWYLGKIADVSEKLTSGLKVADGGLSKPYAVQALRDALKQLGYHPGTHGPVPRSIQDFSSDRRLKLIVDMQNDMATGYGHHVAGQDPILLDAFPCQELYREINSRVHRPWPSIWRRAGGDIYSGRMIALKNDPIWIRLSRFGKPYPPFDYNSGMGVRDITRKEALALGVEGLETPQTPEPMSLTKALAAKPQKRHSDLRAQLLKDLGDIATIDANGVLHIKEAA